MLMIVLFALANVIIASILEQNRLKIATISHAVLFTFFLFCLIFMVPDPMISRYVFALLSESSYAKLVELFRFIAEMHLLIPAVLTEAVILLETAFSAVYLSYRAVKCVVKKIKFRKKAIPVRRPRDLAPVRIGSKIKLNTPKFCYLYCTMLC